MLLYSVGASFNNSPVKGYAMSRVLLMTHHEIYQHNEAFPLQTHRGREKIMEVVEFIMNRIDNDKESGGLAVRRFGWGTKYEHCHSILKKKSVHHSKAKYKSDFILGGNLGSISGLGDLVFLSTGESIHKKDVEWPKHYITPYRGWRYVREMEELANSILPNGYAVLCGGRQFLSILRRKKEFVLGSLYELDWREKSVTKIETQEQS